MRILKAAAFYFLLAFAAGFALGTVRVLWAVPRFGERAAELMEMPLMLVAIILAARWTMRRFTVLPETSANMSIGLIALGLLLVTEFTVVLRLRGLSISEYIAGRDPVSGVAYVLMLFAFALLPSLTARLRPNVTNSSRA